MPSRWGYSSRSVKVQVDEVRSLITEKTKMLVIVSPSNPTGGVLSRASMEALADIAREHDLLVLSDEIYDRFVYDDEQELVSIASLPGMKERSIVLNGFSKSMAMTGWRLGYIAAPQEMIEPMNRLSFYMTAGATTFVQYAGVAALHEEDGAIERMRQEFKRRRDYLVEEINKLEHFSCKKPEGAFYIFINIEKLGMSGQEFAPLLLENAKVAMVPGDVFGSEGDHYIRMSFANSYENVVEGCKRLKEFVEKIRK